MKSKFLLAGLAIALSTSFANANLNIDVVSGATSPEAGTTYYTMCIEDGYIHFESVGSSNNTNGEIPSWTVNSGTYAYGDTFYYVPAGINPDDHPVYTIKLYDGLVINDTVDNQGAPLADTLDVHVISCN